MIFYLPFHDIVRQLHAQCFPHRGGLLEARASDCHEIGFRIDDTSRLAHQAG